MLNTGQTKAYEELSNFMIGTEPEICLTGPGGVGKTFLLAEFVAKALDDYEKMCALLSVPCTIDKICFTATTNKATEILGESLKKSNLKMNYDNITTIHSLLALKVTNSYETGKSNLHTTQGTKMIFNALIIVDEASMIGLNLKGILDTYVDPETCRIIYVGDHAQLPPIKEATSPIFNSPSIKHINLTEPVRQAAGSHLYSECVRLRKAVINSTPVNEIIADNQSIIQLSKKQAFSKLNQVFKTASLDNKILVYTNKQANEFNNYLRKLRCLPKTFTPGEIVVNNTAIHSKYAVSKMPVEALYEIVEDHGLQSYSKTSTKSGNIYTLNVRSYSLKRVNGNSTVFTVQVPDDKEKYQNGLNALKNQKDWAVFYHFKERFPDLRATDACTIHKSQGSTYDNVFIDLQDISKCREANLLRRLLYVAVSRAKEKVYIYGSL